MLCSRVLSTDPTLYLPTLRRNVRVPQAYTVLNTTFSPSEVAALSEATRELPSVTNNGDEEVGNLLGAHSAASSALPRGRRKKRGKGTNAPHVHPEPATKKRRTGDVVEGVAETDEGEDTNAIEVRVTREYGVADKKGQRHQIDRQRTVSKGFGQKSVDAYTAMVSSVLSRKMETLAKADTANRKVKPSADSSGSGKEGSAAEAGEVIGVISYTEELNKNVVRSGVPPPLPEYTKVAMWRGEDVCLDQLGAGGMKELMVGITWCEPKGSHQSVDLDLSVMVCCASCVVLSMLLCLSSRDLGCTAYVLFCIQVCTCTCSCYSSSSSPVVFSCVVVFWGATRVGCWLLRSLESRLRIRMIPKHPRRYFTLLSVWRVNHVALYVLLFCESSHTTK